MTQYRKKPVVIEAWQTYVGGEITKPLWFKKAEDAGKLVWHGPMPGHWTIETLEGVMIAQPRDWIIRGVKGELYPCKPDIFEATYEPVSASPSLQGDEVERVARALYDATPFKETAGGYDQQSDTYKRMCELLARAALSALPRRETVPTLTEEERETLAKIKREHEQCWKCGWLHQDLRRDHDNLTEALSLIDKLAGEG